MEIGKRISELRNKMKLSQRELADCFDASSGAIGMWETGKRQPDLETLIKIASFFDVTIDYLLGIEDNHDMQCIQNTVKTAKLTELSENEKTLLQLFNQCDEQCQKYLIAKAGVLCVEGISAVANGEYGKYVDREKKSFPSNGTDEMRA